MHSDLGTVTMPFSNQEASGKRPKSFSTPSTAAALWAASPAAALSAAVSSTTACFDAACSASAVEMMTSLTGAIFARLMCSNRTRVAMAAVSADMFRTSMWVSSFLQWPKPTMPFPSRYTRTASARSPRSSWACIAAQNTSGSVKLWPSYSFRMREPVFLSPTLLDREMARIAKAALSLPGSRPRSRIRPRYLRARSPRRHSATVLSSAWKSSTAPSRPASADSHA
mmetsp:Transcript_62502/g.164070  ORF Transcript_62502/g.164070 Transcript_62502/m.164070 type:complete len:226 (-) Transcript_62502:91-768(-)